MIILNHTLFNSEKITLLYLCNLSEVSKYVPAHRRAEPGPEPGEGNVIINLPVLVCRLGERPAQELKLFDFGQRVGGPGEAHLGGKGVPVETG